MWICYSALKAAYEFFRTCRWCGTEQKVPMHLKTRPVKCSKCGQKIAATHAGA